MITTDRVDASAVCACPIRLERGRTWNKCRRRTSGRSTTVGEPCLCVCSRPLKQQESVLGREYNVKTTHALSCIKSLLKCVPKRLNLCFSCSMSFYSVLQLLKDQLVKSKILFESFSEKILSLNWPLGSSKFVRKIRKSLSPLDACQDQPSSGRCSCDCQGLACWGRTCCTRRSKTNDRSTDIGGPCLRGYNKPEKENPSFKTCSTKQILIKLFWIVTMVINNEANSSCLLFET